MSKPNEPQELFETYPVLENERIILRKMTETDADALGELAGNAKVYQYLPTFLFEQKYADPREVIARMDAECFDTKESILLGIYLKEESDRFTGIAEIYNYEPKKAKASIGCRLDDRYWGKGIATQTIHLLRDYLAQQIGLRTITAHIMCENKASAHACMKNGFLNKYPDLYGDWGFPQLSHTDKYVYKQEWEEGVLPAVQVEQFVLAYLIEQDRIRAMLPEGFESLRPVLRINAEIRDEKTVYLEFNTPVAADGRRGWLNIASWKSSSGDDLHYAKAGKSVDITAPFLTLTFTETGTTGGCPAEKDNDGCYFLGSDTEFRPAEIINADREFCDCEFAWHFHEGDACGISTSETIPAFAEAVENIYDHLPLTAENAAAVPCRQVLGAYCVRFQRYPYTARIARK